jgi:hypothetical protein
MVLACFEASNIEASGIKYIHSLSGPEASKKLTHARRKNANLLICQVMGFLPGDNP